jgi:hypothetical protein
MVVVMDGALGVRDHIGKRQGTERWTDSAAFNGRCSTARWLSAYALTGCPDLPVA